MNRSNVLATLALILFVGRGMSLAATPAVTPAPESSSVRPSTEFRNTSFEVHPGAVILVSMLAGMGVLLISITGRERLKSLDFERAYREGEKSRSLTFRN